MILNELVELLLRPGEQQFCGYDQEEEEVRRTLSRSPYFYPGTLRREYHFFFLNKKEKKIKELYSSLPASQFIHFKNQLNT